MISFGFNVMLQVLQNVFIETPIKKHGYGLDLKENAYCKNLSNKRPDFDRTLPRLTWSYSLLYELASTIRSPGLRSSVERPGPNVDLQTTRRHMEARIQASNALATGSLYTFGPRAFRCMPSPSLLASLIGILVISGRYRRVRKRADHSHVLH